MKHLLGFIFSICLTTSTVAIGTDSSKAEASVPDTVSVGIYMTSIHNIDFRQKEFSLNLWLWLKYKRAEFDFMQNLEVPMAKTFVKSYATTDTLDDGRIYLLMKLECVMKGTWRIKNFPFDRQKLRFAIENSKYDTRDLVFVADTSGKHYGNFFLMGWEKDSITISTEMKKYETNFGDPTLSAPTAEYSSFKITLNVHRDSTELFMKLFLGMYIAFLIAYSCLFIHADNIDSRLALSVGSLFAVVGNKYIIDSSLPESTSFTLVDTLHGFTMFFILLVVVTSIYALKLMKRGNIEKANRFDLRMAQILFALYIAVNWYFIHHSINFQN
jgi:hypothetical protein